MVLRGLPTLTTDTLKEELGKFNFITTNVATMKGTNQPTFKVNFDNGTQISEIKKITRVLGCQTHWQKYKRSSGYTQCYRCQIHGHAARNCFAPPKCVKCAGNHLTSECVKPKDTPATCANCAGSHPANYRQCIAYLNYLEKVREKHEKQNPKRYIPAPLSKSNPWGQNPTSSFNLATEQFPPLPTKRTETTSKTCPTQSQYNSPNEDLNSILNDIKEINSMCNLKEMANIIRELKIKLSTCTSKLDKLMVFSDFSERFP